MLCEEKLNLIHEYNIRRYVGADWLFQVTEAFMKGEISKEVYCECVADTALQLREDSEDVKVIMAGWMTEIKPMWFGSWKH